MHQLMNEFKTQITGPLPFRHTHATTLSSGAMRATLGLVATALFALPARTTANPCVNKNDPGMWPGAGNVAGWTSVLTFNKY